MDEISRLKTLIGKSRSDMYKPIAIAEILYRVRCGLDSVSLTDKESYRRPSYGWMQEVIRKISNKTTQLNSRYWDQLFDDGIMDSGALNNLASLNSSGCVEEAIYAIREEKFFKLREILQLLNTGTEDSFSFQEFIDHFTGDSGLKRSVDRF